MPPSRCASRMSDLQISQAAAAWIIAIATRLPGVLLN
jgi:hypothetical protein